ncbi:MAG: hypothetical protein PHE43_00050 [Candidatus Nanoarchaeia archaeon]|nr:hypothetical protein [Candidatus Nanoarchaeia archaeon]
MDTGSEVLNKLIKEYSGITCLFGQSGTGKSTFCFISAISEAKKGNKVLFLDSETSFSIERMKQLGGEKYLDNILMVNVKTIRELQDSIRMIPSLGSKISLIIVDTISYHYRNVLRKKPELARTMLLSQLRMLKKISEKIPVLITSQVYQDIENQVQKPVGGMFIAKESNNLIKLIKEPRKAVLIKPERDHCYFRIENEGIFEN